MQNIEECKSSPLPSKRFGSSFQPRYFNRSLILIVFQLVMAGSMLTQYEFLSYIGIFQFWAISKLIKKVGTF